MALNAPRYRQKLLSITALLVLVLVLAACSTSTPLMAVLFDIPPPGSPTELGAHPPRRVARSSGPVLLLSKEYVALQEALVKAGPPPNWPDVFKKLPKDDDNNIDWMTALASKAISPSGVIDDKDKDEGKTSDDDIELSTSGKPNRMVIFSHTVHTQWLTCTNCHNAIFKREAGSATITMDAIDDGKYCGVCHDKVALAQPSGCKGCHKPIKKS